MTDLLRALASGDGRFDAAGLPGLGRVDEGGEQGAGERAGNVGALGVPLHGDDVVIGGIELDGLDDAVGRRDGGDAEVVAWGVNGLVVAGVDGRRGGAVCIGGLGIVFFHAPSRGPLGAGGEIGIRQGGGLDGLEDGGEAGVGRDGDGMGIGDAATGAVIDGGADDGGQILDEGAVAPDIEGLCAMADAEDGLVQIEGVLEEELVDGGAGGVVGAAGGDRGFAVALGIDIEKTAGEEDAVGGGEEFGDAIGALVERDEDNGCSCRLQGGDVGRKTPLVVFSVDGGLGDSDADGHG